MKDLITRYKFYKRKRADVPLGSTEEKISNCPREDLGVVLKDWEKVRMNYKKIGTDVFMYFLSEHPFYKDAFPSLADVTFDDLEENENFLIHAYAIIKGINSIMCNLSAKYEEDNEILPFISYTHNKRGITQKMMNHMKEALLFNCGIFLQSNKKEKNSWNTVLNFIFNDYLLRDLPREEDEGVMGE